MEYIPKLLIVDDEINILKSLKRILNEYKLDVFLTVDTQEALEIVNKHSIDLILSDQRMPTMSGLDLLEKVKEISPNTVRLLMSGYSDIEVVIKALNNGNIYQYITKPWSNDEIVKSIFHALENKVDIKNISIIRRRDLLNRIVLEQATINNRMMEELRYEGIDIELPIFLCLIEVSENETVDTYQINNKLILIFSKVPGLIPWDCNGRIGILLHINISEVNEYINKMIAKIKDVLTNNYAELTYYIGISRSNMGLDSLQRSYAQAYSSLVAARTNRKSENVITHYNDLGILQLLIPLHEQIVAREFVEERLGRLIEYDLSKGGELVETLKVLLKCNNLKEAAEALYIHPKTLVFRRNRIEQILGLVLEDYETSLSLSIAIKLLDIMPKKAMDYP